MVLLSSPICEFGKRMPEFKLKGQDNKIFDSQKLVDFDAILIFFICNHCPYVKAVIKELVLTSIELKKEKVVSVAIMPNDTIKYPEDSFENMKKFSEINTFNFPYLLDDNQEVSKKFDAVCTPDFFGYNRNRELQYRGRLFEMKNLEIVDKKNSFIRSYATYCKNWVGPKKQIPSSGCSIKWR